VCVLLLASRDGACINRTNTSFEAKHCRILTFLWKLKVHYCVYRSLKHLNLFYTLVPYFFNICFNTVSHLYLSQPRGLFPSSCSKTPVLKVIYLSSFIWSSQYFLVNNTNFEAPHYAVFSSYLLLLLLNMF
jgi:hypothetical protein